MKLRASKGNKIISSSTFRFCHKKMVESISHPPKLAPPPAQRFGGKRPYRFPPPPVVPRPLLPVPSFFRQSKQKIHNGISVRFPSSFPAIQNKTKCHLMSLRSTSLSTSTSSVKRFLNFSHIRVPFGRGSLHYSPHGGAAVANSAAWKPDCAAFHGGTAAQPARQCSGARRGAKAWQNEG